MSSKEVRSEELLKLVTSLQTLNASQQQTIINRFVSISYQCQQSIIEPIHFQYNPHIFLCIGNVSICWTCWLLFPPVLFRILSAFICFHFVSVGREDGGPDCVPGAGGSHGVGQPSHPGAPCPFIREHHPGYSFIVSLHEPENTIYYNKI